jgi:ankyrin repeat protein
MFAAYNGHTDIVEALLAGGADVNAKTNGGRIALKMAEEAGHKNIIILLKQAGATE